MIHKRLFDYDPTTRTREVFRYDPATDEFFIETLVDVEPVIELTEAEFRQFDERSPWKGDMHKVASIPVHLVAKLEEEGIWYDDHALLRWLDDPANRRFRTRPGSLSR